MTAVLKEILVLVSPFMELLGMFGLCTITASGMLSFADEIEETKEDKDQAGEYVCIMGLIISFLLTCLFGWGLWKVYEQIF